VTDELILAGKLITGDLLRPFRSPRHHHERPATPAGRLSGPARRRLFFEVSVSLVDMDEVCLWSTGHYHLVGSPFGKQRRGERSATAQPGTALSLHVQPTATRVGDIIIHGKRIFSAGHGGCTGRDFDACHGGIRTLHVSPLDDADRRQVPNAPEAERLVTQSQ